MWEYSHCPVRITFSSKLVNNRVKESSAFTISAKVYTDDTDVWTLSVPTSLRYRIDDPYRDAQILNWTSLTADDEFSIVVTSSQNAIVDNCRAEERRQLTLQVNAGLSTQVSETYDWWVQNLAGQT